MTQQVHTLGYSNIKLPRLAELVDELDAIVFDVRFSPRSRNPTWSGGNLRAVLGDRYRHVKDLGNRNYRGGPIDLVDYEAGRQQIEQSDKPVILMCVCSDYARCHRSTIAARLRAEGFQVTELPASPHEPQQLRLLECP